MYYSQQHIDFKSLLHLIKIIKNSLLMHATDNNYDAAEHVSADRVMY